MTAPARFASKKAETLAGAFGIEDVKIVGTGSDGRITIADVRAAAPKPAPEDLGDDGRVLWEGVMAEYQLRPDETPLLLAACQLADEIAAMRAALGGADLVVAGSHGQVRPHPLVPELRQHRLALSRLLGSLGLTDSDDDMSRSAMGRKLAHARWDRGA
jgi:pyruvate/2-oxoglutarate dehydrogenase complex dihydrolipoamide acyltransferase (E2) component